MYASFRPIEWRCHLSSNGDREIAGNADWIDTGRARINNDVRLAEISLSFSIRAISEIEEGKVGLLCYDPPWYDEYRTERDDAQLRIVLVVSREQFADLWERERERVPQRGFIEIDGFKDENQYASSNNIWEIDTLQRAEARIKACTFQNTIALTAVSGFTDRLSKRHDEPPPQHRAILKELSACIAREYAESREVRHGDIEDTFAKVEKLIDNLETALDQRAVDQKDSSSKQRWIWLHGDPVAVFREGLKSPNHRMVDKESLSGVVREYLQMPYLRSDLLEWIIVDAFVFYEIQEFGETIKQGKGLKSLASYWARDGRQRGGAWLFWPLFLTPIILTCWIAGLAYLTARSGDSLLMALLVFGAYVIFFMWLTGRQIFVSLPDQKPPLLQEMMSAYALLDFQMGVASPHAVRERLLNLQNKGAIWDTAAMAILDTATVRDRPAWLS